MIYMLDTNKIKSKAFDKIAEIKSGEKIDVSVKDVIKASQLAIDIIEEFGEPLDGFEGWENG